MGLDYRIPLEATHTPADFEKSYQQGFDMKQAQINAPIETQEKQANADTAQLKLASAKLGAIGNLLEGVDSQESYDAHMKAGIDMGLIPPEFAQKHPIYTPEGVSSFTNTLSQQKDRVDMQLKQAQIGETQAHANFFNNGGAMPAAEKMADAMQKARASGDLTRYNELAAAGKLLNKDQQYNFPVSPNTTNIPTDAGAQAMSPAQVASSGMGASPTIGRPNSAQPSIVPVSGAQDSAASLAESKASGANTIKYNDQITNDAKQAINMHLTVGAMKDALTNFQAGATAPARATLQRYATALGIPVDTKSLDNQQVFTKLANDVVAQAAKQEGGASRLAAAYNGLVQANPNASLEPGSLSILLDKMDAQAGEVTNELQAWNQAKKDNPNLSAAEFRRNYTSGIAQQQEAAGGGIPAYKGAANNYIAPGDPSNIKVTPKDIGGLNLQDARVKTALAHGYTPAQIAAYLKGAK